MHLSVSTLRVLGFAAVLSPFAVAQTATALLQEGGSVPGAPGATISGISNTAVNLVGGYSATIVTDGAISHVWGDPFGGPGTVLRTESTIGNLEQTAFESFFGMADGGELAYGTTTTDTVSMETGLDGVFLDGTLIANELEPVPTIPGAFYRFCSRPGITGNGNPYWISGLDDAPDGANIGRALLFGAGATPLLQSGDIPTGLSAPLTTGNAVDFDSRLSGASTSWITVAETTETSSANNYIVTGTTSPVTATALVLGGGLVGEGQPIAAAIGGQPGETWDNFDFLGINEAGNYFFTGDIDGATTSTDEIVVLNGQIIHREGDTLDGEILAGSIEGASMNEVGDLAFIWDIESPSGDLEALFFNGRLLLAEGDRVDLDGDGVIDPDAVLVNFTGISSLTLGIDRRLYFTADIDVNGTTTTSDDIEGFFCLEAEDGWSRDRSFGGLGTNGVPGLVGSGPTDGSAPAAIQLIGGVPSSTGILLVGSVIPPFALMGIPGSLGVNPFVAVDIGTDAVGNYRLDVTTGVPPGLEFGWQTLTSDPASGFTFSTLLVLTSGFD